jgi:hypothetical protein
MSLFFGEDDLLGSGIVLFWCVKFWPFSFLVCLILATVFPFFFQLIQNVNGSILISTSDTMFLLLLTAYFDVVLKTKSIICLPVKTMINTSAKLLFVVFILNAF